MKNISLQTYSRFFTCWGLRIWTVFHREVKKSRCVENEHVHIQAIWFVFINHKTTSDFFTIYHKEIFEQSMLWIGYASNRHNFVSDYDAEVFMRSLFYLWITTYRTSKYINMSKINCDEEIVLKPKTNMQTNLFTKSI